MQQSLLFGTFDYWFRNESCLLFKDLACLLLKLKDLETDVSAEVTPEVVDLTRRRFSIREKVKGLDPDLLWHECG